MEEPVIKHRTFDPESRGLKKHSPEDDIVMEDTVEKKVDGLAEQIIAEDAERRAQELVGHVHVLSGGPVAQLQCRICSTLPPNGLIGI